MRFLRSRNPSHLSDEDIIERFRNTQNPSLIGILFDRYSYLVYSVSFNYLKDEDDCKDVVLQIFENLSTDLKKYEIKNFSSWLHVVTKNHCLRQLSRKKESVPITDKIILTNEEDDEPAFNIHLPNLESAIDQLNEGQKICIDLFYLKELSYKQISETTGYDINQVKSYIQNGKRNLKLILTKQK